MTKEDGSQPQHTPEELVKLWSNFMIEGARYGDAEDVQQALQNSANVDAQDEDGRTALHMAAANAHTEISEMLLIVGANTEIKNSAGNTALHWACISGSAPAVQLLLVHGASPTVLNSAGQTPIDGALDNEAICRLFQEHDGTLAGDAGIADVGEAAGYRSANGVGVSAQEPTLAALVSEHTDPTDTVAETLEGAQLD